MAFPYLVEERNRLPNGSGRLDFDELDGELATSPPAAPLRRVVGNRNDVGAHCSSSVPGA